MDKVLEQVLKYVPASFVPAIIGLIIAFFGIYYFKGIRSYTDALNDRAFLTAAILIVGAFLVIQVQKSDVPRISSDTRPLLLVPRFENDVGRELETLFVTQLRSAVERSLREASIVQLNAYVRDKDSAQLNAESSKALAVLFEPKIVREGENGAVLCFRLLLLDTGRIATFSAVPAAIEKMNLSDLSNALTGLAGDTGPVSGNPMLARLDALEREVAELSNAFQKTAAIVWPATNGAYPAKRAVVIGVNYDEQGHFPRLRFAASDAKAMGSILEAYGFETSVLLNEEATRPHIREAIDSAIRKSHKNDLLLIFYAGASARLRDLGASQADKLILPTFDLQVVNPSENLTLNDLVEQLWSASQLHRLIVLDGCHGTYGVANWSADAAQYQNANVFQIIAASRDDQLAFELENEGGGIFTQTIVAQLKALADSHASISTHALIAAIAPDITRLSSGKQSPKLVTLAGTEDVIFQRDR